VIAEHTARGATVILASEQAIKKLLDEVSPGRLRLIDKEFDRDRGDAGNAIVGRGALS